MSSNLKTSMQTVGNVNQPSVQEAMVTNVSKELIRRSKTRRKVTTRKGSSGGVFKEIQLAENPPSLLVQTPITQTLWSVIQTPDYTTWYVLKPSNFLDAATVGNRSLMFVHSIKAWTYWDTAAPATGKQKVYSQLEMRPFLPGGTNGIDTFIQYVDVSEETDSHAAVGFTTTATSAGPFRTADRFVQIKTNVDRVMVAIHATFM